VQIKNFDRLLLFREDAKNGSLRWSSYGRSTASSPTARSTISA